MSKHNTLGILFVRIKHSFNKCVSQRSLNNNRTAHSVHSWVRLSTCVCVFAWCIASSITCVFVCVCVWGSRYAYIGRYTHSFNVIAWSIVSAILAHSSCLLCIFGGPCFSSIPIADIISYLDYSFLFLAPIIQWACDSSEYKMSVPTKAKRAHALVTIVDYICVSFASFNFLSFFFSLSLTLISHIFTVK